MDAKLPQLNCPACNKPISYNYKEWRVICNSCGKKLELVWHNEKVVSIRRNINSLSTDNSSEILENFVACIESNFSFKKWGFVKKNLLSHGVIYSSDSCRVKFTIGNSNYHPMLDTEIYYGRLHALDNDNYMIWNGKRCLCWHKNLIRTIPFIEGIPPKIGDHVKFWENLNKKLNLDFPTWDYIEHPLRFNSELWERYGNKIFNIFDLRNSELWEKYSKFLNVLLYNGENFC